MGSNDDAFRAGAIPNTIPIPLEIPKDKTTAHGGIGALTGANLPISDEPPKPKIIPIAPPIVDSTIASMRNCQSMVDDFAPIALRKPISPVLSDTETSMTFMIPIPPTISEIPATVPKNMVNAVLT